MPGTVLKISGPGFKASATVIDLCTEEVDGKKLYAVEAHSSLPQPENALEFRDPFTKCRHESP
jgi:hypothetical protein